MKEPTIQIGCVSNVYIRMMHFHNAGDIEHGHSHEFDHVSFLSKGSIKMTVEGVDATFKAPHMIFVKKDLDHRIESLENDSILCCIHALRDMDHGTIIDPDQIPYDSSPTMLPHRPV
jgi:quercetin dioxygenase-like cupin family protein